MSGNLPVADNNNETQKYFNNFFKSDLRTSPEIDDAVVSFFETLTGNRDSARTLASSVLFTALNQGISPMEIIDQFRKVPPNELNSFMAMFLNLDRIPTSLLGITNTPQPNKYIQRAILA